MEYITGKLSAALESVSADAIKGAKMLGVWFASHTTVSVH